MLPCKLCYTLDGIDAEFGTLHDRKTHAQLHAFQSGYISEDGEQMSVKLLFGQCFPLEDFFEKPMEPMESTEKTKVVEKSRSVLMEICKKIIAEKKNESKSIECQLCKSNVRYCVRSNGAQSTQLILEHGCSHSTKKPFVCRQCQRVMATKRNLVQHVKDCHKIDSPISGVHFDENWAICFDEVKEMLTECFGDSVVDISYSEPVASPKMRTRKRKPKPKTPSSKMHRKRNDVPLSEMAIQRRSMFSDALKNTNDAGKIRCGKCRGEICASSTRQLEQHVGFHLRRGIYKCTKCGRSSPYKSGIMRHLAKEHGFLSQGNYIDRSDDYHEAILAWLKICFGKEESK